MILESEKEKPKESPRKPENFFEKLPRKGTELSSAIEQSRREVPEVEPRIPEVKESPEDNSEEALISNILELFKNKKGAVIDDIIWIEKMNMIGEIISKEESGKKRIDLIDKMAQEIIAKPGSQFTEGFLITELEKAIKRIERDSQD